MEKLKVDELRKKCQILGISIKKKNGSNILKKDLVKILQKGGKSRRLRKSRSKRLSRGGGVRSRKSRRSRKTRGSRKTRKTRGSRKTQKGGSNECEKVYAFNAFISKKCNDIVGGADTPSIYMIDLDSNNIDNIKYDLNITDKLKKLYIRVNVPNDLRKYDLKYQSIVSALGIPNLKLNYSNTGTGTGQFKKNGYTLFLGDNKDDDSLHNELKKIKHPNYTWTIEFIGNSSKNEKEIYSALQNWLSEDIGLYAGSHNQIPKEYSEMYKLNIEAIDALVTEKNAADAGEAKMKVRDRINKLEGNRSLSELVNEVQNPGGIRPTKYNQFHK